MSDLYQDLPVIDLSVPDWWRDPAVVTAPMHEAGAVAAFVPDFATVSFLRYDTCLEALGDPALLAMGARYFEAQGWTSGPFVDWIRLNVVMTYFRPDEHGLEPVRTVHGDQPETELAW